MTAVVAPEQPPFVPVTEAAELIGISRAFAYELVKAGEIPTVAFGRRRVVPTCWLYERAEAAAQAWRDREVTA